MLIQKTSTYCQEMNAKSYFENKILSAVRILRAMCTYF